LSPPGQWEKKTRVHNLGGKILDGKSSEGTVRSSLSSQAMKNVVGWQRAGKGLPAVGRGLEKKSVDSGKGHV